MDSLNDDVRAYTTQLRKGQIQKAYKGIMNFMSDLKTYLERKYPDHVSSAIYVGYMDMTYFAFSPPLLKNKKLKIAIVFLHAECKFELWLAGSNRSVQAHYIELLRQRDIGRFTLSQPHSGVDSIIALSIIDAPNFDDLDGLKQEIDVMTGEFTKDIIALLQ